MTPASRLSASRTSDSTDRLPTLPAAKAATGRPKTAATRFGSAARRFLNALMRSLASPHV